MPDFHEHLDLPSTNKEYKKKPRRGGGGYKPNENIKNFAEEQIEKLNVIGKEFDETSKQFPKYKQELVFKVKTSQNVNEKEFRRNLKSANCETIISTHGKNAEWIISTPDSKFKKLKERIEKRTERENANFIDGISEFSAIKFQDKLGGSLIESPLGPIEKTKVVISLSKKESDPNDEKLNRVLQLIRNLSQDYDLSVHDKLITKNVYLILVDGTLNFIKTVSKIDLVEKIDRPPKFSLEKIINKSIQDMGNITPPNQNNHGVLIMDSGIILHPLLDSAVDSNDGIVGLDDRINTDDRHHGTMVSGIALHGDIEKCIHDENFNADIWIYSAKIFYESNGKIVDSDEKLIGTKIMEGLKEIKDKFPKCKIVNLSFGGGAKTKLDRKKQFDLAVIIDDLANKYSDMIFVISTGNISQEYTRNAEYPDYLLSDDSFVKIVDPATSIHAISVGSVQKFGDANNQPSNLTKVGPGLNGMIKPEFVENGGGFGDEIIVLNPDFQQRLFSLTGGTSFSAPKISHYLAKLYNKFPSYHRNLIKALLLSSANLPDNIPDSFPKIDSSTALPQWSKLTSVYGFGKPNLDAALMSDDNRVVMKFSGKIKMNKVKYFTIKLPDEFVKERGNREISISLVYDPPICNARADYFGVQMEFHLFKNAPIEEVMEKYNSVDLDDDKDEKVPEELSGLEIVLKPGTKLRKKGIHQKGIKTLSTRSRIDNENPLVLAVLSQKRWDFDDDFEQNFAVVVTLKHATPIDLYNKIRLKNQTRVQI